MRIENAWVTSPAHVAILEVSDLDGCAVWKRILRAVEELQGTVPGRDERVH